MAKCDRCGETDLEWESDIVNNNTRWSLYTLGGKKHVCPEDRIKPGSEFSEYMNRKLRNSRER